MLVDKSANFKNFIEFMACLEKLKESDVVFNFSGSINRGEDNSNFSINWTSEEEV